ncbi:MAG: putative quinol monooxygenase [Microcystaceae cyanobacterium]
MSEQKVTVTVRFKVKLGLEEQFKQACLPLLALTLTEEGCLTYNLHQSRTNPRVFMLYEQWSNKEALDKHLKMPYIQGLGEKGRDFLAEPFEVNFWEQV